MTRPTPTPTRIKTVASTNVILFLQARMESCVERRAATQKLTQTTKTQLRANHNAHGGGVDGVCAKKVTVVAIALLAVNEKNWWW